MPDKSLLPEFVTFDLASGNRVDVYFAVVDGSFVTRQEWKFKPFPSEARAVDNFADCMAKRFCDVEDYVCIAEGPSVDSDRIEARTSAYLATGRPIDPLSN